MQFTGERVIPKQMNPKNGMLREHIARYQFAAPYAWGRVLDLATGSGYGTAILIASPSADNILEIVGADISWETINYARWHYPHPKVRFVQADALDPNLPRQLGLFDTIISFETIEHIRQDYAFLTNLKALARPGGTIILSTPFGKGRNQPCSDPFHVGQYTPAEFERLTAAFRKATIYHQADTTIELPVPNRRYWLGVAVCER